MEFQIGIRINGIFFGWKSFTDTLEAFQEIEETLLKEEILDFPAELETELLGHEV